MRREHPYTIVEAGYWKSPVYVLTGLTWFVWGIGFTVILTRIL